MKTKSGMLFLGKREREALEVIKRHTLTDISFDGEGSYNLGDDNNFHDEKEANKAMLGIDVINFVLQITK